MGGIFQEVTLQILSPSSLEPGPVAAPPLWKDFIADAADVSLPICFALLSINAQHLVAVVSGGRSGIVKDGEQITALEDA